jgi:tetratricopeptide (TPR) repeat protein
VHLTGGDFSPLSSIFLVSSFFCSQAESTPAHLPETHTVRQQIEKEIDMSLLDRQPGKTESRADSKDELNETTALFVFNYSQMAGAYGRQTFYAIYSALRNSRGTCVFQDGDFRNPEAVRELALQARIVKPSYANSPLHDLETPYNFGAYVVAMWSDVPSNLAILHQELTEKHLAGYQGFMVFPGKYQPEEFIRFAQLQLRLPQALVLKDGQVGMTKYGTGETKMPEDNFQEIENRIEQEAEGIRGRRKDIEQEALRVFNYFKADVNDATRAKLTAERLLNGSVWSSQQSNDVVAIAAIAALRVAIEIDDTCWKAYYNLGWHYLSIGKKLHEPYMGKITISDGESYYKSLATRTSFYQAAIKYLNKALELNPKDAKIWCVLGQTQYYIGNYDQARATLGKAIALDPTGEGGLTAVNALAVLENSLNLK